MPRDYKHKRAPRRRKKDDAPGWVWMLWGLAIGLAVALAVYINDRRPRLETAPVARAAVPSSSGAEQSDGPASAEESATRFDFYELLPKFEVIIPEREQDVKPDTRVAALDNPGTYVLQAGSFQSFPDADRMQATLAMLGIESRLQKVTIDRDTWHRVRVGPVEDLDELNRLRRKLREAEIEILVIRVGD